MPWFPRPSGSEVPLGVAAWPCAGAVARESVEVAPDWWRVCDGPGKEAAMTEKTRHVPARPGVTSNGAMGAVPGNDGLRRGGRLRVRDVSLFVDIIGYGYPLLLMHGGLRWITGRCCRSGSWPASSR
jgi:hypothetical protein